MTRVFLGLLAGIVAAGAPWVGDPSPAPVTFYKDVLPILQNRCQSCHRPGQIAPISFLTYRETRPWAEAMRAMVLSRRMPPWSAGSGRITGVIYHLLTQAEIDMIAKWVETGAPAGNPKDAPAPLYTEQWAYSRPPSSSVRR